jgi:ribonuclease R
LLLKNKKITLSQLEIDVLAVFETYKGRILNHKQVLSRLENPDLNISIEQVLSALENLSERGEIVRRESFKFYMPARTHEIEGVIDVSKNGRVFLMVEGEDDDYVVENSNIKLLPFDRVIAKPVKTSGKNKKAEVVKLINHSEKHYVGVLNKRNSYWFVEPDSNKFKVPFDVRFSHHLKVGLKVVFKIKGFGKESKFPQAEIIEILGKQGDHLTEMHSILAEFGLPEAFEDDIVKAADKIDSIITDQDVSEREDYRKVLTFTIDPDTAKDFDDAISYQTLENGQFEVGVHIADVSHYVKPNDTVDTEAYKRATSVYLVDRVVPMLPFNLSDNICSLVPNEDRLTFAAIFTFSEKFEILDTRFSKTIIHSDKRFSYEEAQEILDKKEGVYFKELNHLNQLAKHLNKLRFQSGSLSFESTEYKFVLDEKFKPISMIVKTRQDTNKLIEELMLLANKSVAKFIYTQKPRKPFVYRTHDEPNETKLLELKKFVAKFGYKLEIDNEKLIRTSMNQLSKEIEGKVEQDVIQNMCIRSMSKAAYTPNKPSHYGLAFEYYTHFTSPIRRYPDVIVHRLLFGYLNGQSMLDITHWNTEQLDAACKHSSKMEITAAEAERASIKYKQAEWMEQHIGKQFEGVITGLTDFGMFVEIKDFKCEGMVRLNNIIGDHYEYDNNLMIVIGRRHFRQFKMGDNVEVVVTDASRKNRTIDLNIVMNQQFINKKHGKSSHQF